MNFRRGDDLKYAALTRIKDISLLLENTEEKVTGIRTKGKDEDDIDDEEDYDDENYDDEDLDDEDYDDEDSVDDDDEGEFGIYILHITCYLVTSGLRLATCYLLGCRGVGRGSQNVDNNDFYLHLQRPGFAPSTMNISRNLQ